MDFDYSEREWTVGKHVYISQPSLGAWELALFREKLQEAAEKSPLGANLPPKLSAKYATEVSKAMTEYSMRYPKYAGLIGCECMLVPKTGSPPFAEAVKGLDLIQVATQLAPLMDFFFTSVKDSMPNAKPLPITGKASKGTRKGSRSVTTSR